MSDKFKVTYDEEVPATNRYTALLREFIKSDHTTMKIEPDGISVNALWEGIRKAVQRGKYPVKISMLKGVVWVEKKSAE